MPDLFCLREWTGEPGELVLWLPSPETEALVSTAPVSPIPPSHEQEQHLQAFHTCALRQEPMARLIIVAWEMEGRCDLRILDDLIHAHLRRHDTYHSWFEYRGTGIVRHHVDDPAALRLVATAMGTATAADWQRHIEATPGPFAWDCFRFGIVQRDDSFTAFASVDHLHADASLAKVMMRELHRDYRRLLIGESLPRERAVGRYLEHCEIQRRQSAGLQLSDVGVAHWIDFMGANGGRLPRFSLELGPADARCMTEYVATSLLSPTGAREFERACLAAGARLVGGVIACTALADRELAGVDHCHVVTPTSTRGGPDALRMSGWCVGLVPVSVQVAGLTFAQAARSAQRSFDERRRLATIPVERVLELAAGRQTVRPPGPGVMVSLLDAKLPPFGPQFATDWHTQHGRFYMNTGMAGQVALWFFRTHRGLSLTAGYPATDVAREALSRYIEAIRTLCREVADR